MGVLFANVSKYVSAVIECQFCDIFLLLVNFFNFPLFWWMGVTCLPDLTVLKRVGSFMDLIADDLLHIEHDFVYHLCYMMMMILEMEKESGLRCWHRRSVHNRFVIPLWRRLIS